MLIDLTTVPFSCRGSWMAISMLPAGWNGLQNCFGLYLRTIHSSARTPLVARLREDLTDYFNILKAAKEQIG